MTRLKFEIKANNRKKYQFVMEMYSYEMPYATDSGQYWLHTRFRKTLSDQRWWSRRIVTIIRQTLYGEQINIHSVGKIVMLKSTCNLGRSRSGTFLAKIQRELPLVSLARKYNMQKKRKQTEKYILCSKNRWRSCFFWSPSSTTRFIRLLTNLNAQSSRRVKTKLSYIHA
jgi:hypothetical protein